MLCNFPRRAGVRLEHTRGERYIFLLHADGEKNLLRLAIKRLWELELCQHKSALWGRLMNGPKGPIVSTLGNLWNMAQLRFMDFSFSHYYFFSWCGGKGKVGLVKIKSKKIRICRLRFIEYFLIEKSEINTLRVGEITCAGTSYMGRREGHCQQVKRTGATGSVKW